MMKWDSPEEAGRIMSEMIADIDRIEELRGRLECRRAYFDTLPEDIALVRNLQEKAYHSARTLEEAISQYHDMAKDFQHLLEELEPLIPPQI